jgi:hypothetical protein
MSSDRNVENAYKAAFKVVSKEAAERRRLLNKLLVIALLADILLLAWIFRFA